MDRPVDAVAITADGRRAVSGGHDGPVDAVAISADGRHAVSGGDDGTVRAWDLEEGVEFAVFASDSTISELAVYIRRYAGDSRRLNRTGTSP
jgi:WD40 repeat protein